MDSDRKIKLNSRQEEAVKHVKGPLLTVAGAGTGKTFLLIEKIKHLISKKLAKPEEILALTFTEKASSEMEERVDKALPYGYFQIWISTFHSFADQVLKDEIANIGLNPSYKLLTDAESVIFLRNNLFLFDLKYYRPLSSPNKFIEALINHFSRLKDEDISPQEYLNWVKKLQKNKNYSDEEKLRNLELAKAYELYQKLKIKEGYLDFSDLIYYLLEVFRKREEVLNKYRQLFKYILVDEFQDTNIAQYELVKLLCPPTTNPNLTVVGDDSQAIYKFRGASVSNILNFMKDYSKAKLVTLVDNYRSNQQILDFSYKLIKNNDPDTLESQLGISKKLISKGNRHERNERSSKAVNFYLGENVQKEADFVTSEILKLKKERDYHFSDFAILVRANNYAEPFMRSLSQHGIPFQFWGPAMLFRQPEIKDLICYLNVLADPEDTMSLYRVLSIDIFEINQTDIAFLLSFAKKVNLSLFSVIEVVLGLIEKKDYKQELEIYKRFLPSIKEDTVKKISKIHDIIKKHLKRVKKDTAGQILYYFLEDTKLLSTLINYKTEKEEKRALNLSKFFTRLKNYENEHEDASVFALVDYIKMSMELGESPLVAQTDIDLYDAVNILTVHATKGLEFPVVFLINLVQGRFPSIERREKIPIPKELIKEILPKGNFHTLEERRLFYVGLTRAMDSFYLTAANLYGEGKRERKLSQFVVETLGENFIRKTQSLEKDKKSQLSIFDYKKKDEIILKKLSPLDFFSFSQIQTYIRCPLQYKLKYILRIPEPQSSAASFGTSIHITLENFYKEYKENKKLGLDRLLEIYEQSWIPLGYSTRSHQNKMREEGRKMLRNFFSKLHSPDSEIFDLERKFILKLNDVKISGKIDRVDKKLNGNLEIIDYKTGKKGSEKELQKNLQLSIYLLAATDPSLYNKKTDQVELSFYFLQEGEKVSVKKHESLDEIRKTLMKTVDEIRNIDFYKDSLKACNKCPYCVIYSDTYI